MGIRNYQRDTLAAIADGKHLIRASCGSGKTLTSLMWAKSTGKSKVLVVTTASVRDSRGFEREIIDEFPELLYEWYKSLSSLSVISWGTLAKWTNANWNSLDEWAIIFDECLPADTPVQTKHGEVQIADLKVGDEVLSYNEETKQTEYKHVTRLIKKSAPDKMYYLRSYNGAIISTGNHPHYTQRGWIPASEIKVGDVLYELCNLPKGDNQSKSKSKTQGEIGKASLLQLRLRNDSYNQEQSSTQQTDGVRTQDKEIRQVRTLQSMWEETPYERFNGETNTGHFGERDNILQSRMFGQTPINITKSENESRQSNGQSSMETQSYTNKTSQRCATYMDFKTRTQGRQWQLQSTTNHTVGRTVQDKQWLGNGATCQPWEENPRVPKQLQAGHRECLLQNGDRMRWAKPQFSSEQEEGQEEGRQIEGVRVESIEVLQRDDIKRCKLYRDPDYVYCIDIEDNHNFFANGFLTHNCHRGKAGVSSNQGKAFLQIALHTDCWTGWTATPGDKWEDYYAYFTATRYTKNKTDFNNRFCVWLTHPFPKLIAHQNEDEYMRIKAAIFHEVDSSDVDNELPEAIHQRHIMKQPAGYKKVMKTHETIDGNFLDNASALAHYCRRLCASKQKLEWLVDFMDGLDGSAVVFYNYTEEGDAIASALQKHASKVWRISGDTHDVPTRSTIGAHDVVLAQWQAGAFGLNLQFINQFVSFTPHYSYTVSDQARRRILRQGQTNTCYYHYLICENTIDEQVYKILKDKAEFDEELWFKGEYK